MKLDLKIKEISEDVINPVNLYDILRSSEYSFLLESAEGQEKIGRFSILGYKPLYIFRLKKRTCILDKLFFKKERKIFTISDPFLPLREILGKFSLKADTIKELPFIGGWVGFIGYEVVNFFEPVKPAPLDILNFFDIFLIFPKIIFIFDHFKRRLFLINVLGNTGELKSILKKIEKKSSLKPVNLEKKKNLKFVSNFRKAEFLEIVKKAKKMITEGEIIQVVLSQIFKCKAQIDPFITYRILRILNPSPYMFFLKFSDQVLFGSSPEMLVKVKDKKVYTRPIAGTRPRGRDEKEEEILEKELINSEKERAEHIMLVDLGRNDLGRVSKQGSVKVDVLMKIEKYSHVMHIVSQVSGELDKNKDIFDALQSCFPAGTVTGAPKVRAMQIISELEKVQRGPYAGCVGYFDVRNTADTCITIRSVVNKGNSFFVQAGAGIVYDSVPLKEHYEILKKAQAQILALEIAKSNRR